MTGCSVTSTTGSLLGLFYFFFICPCPPPASFDQITDLDSFAVQSGDCAAQSSTTETANLQLGQMERGKSRAATLSQSLPLHWITYNMKVYPKLYSNSLPPPATTTDKKQIAIMCSLPSLLPMLNICWSSITVKISTIQNKVFHSG